jgi:hypothetical protein
MATPCSDLSEQNPRPASAAGLQTPPRLPREEPHAVGGALKQKYPNKKLLVLCIEKHREVLSKNPYIDQLDLILIN